MKNTLSKLCGYLTLMGLLSSGCMATVPLASPEVDRQAKKRFSSPDKSLIYVYRISQYAGSASLIDIIIDERNYIGSAAPGTYFLLEVAPGVHSITTSPVPMITTPKISISCQSGQVYFVSFSIELFFPVFKLVDEFTGRKALASSKLIKTVSLVGDSKPTPVTEHVEKKSQMTSETLLENALTARDSGHYSEAMFYFRVAMQIDPQNPIPYEKASSLFLNRCDPDGAIKVAEKGLKITSNNQALRKVLVRAHSLKNNATIAPTPSQSFVCRARELNREGVTLAREGNQLAALTKFEEAIQAAPGLIPKAHYNLALILEESGKPKESVSHYVKAQQSFLLPEEEFEALTRLVALSRQARIAVPEIADQRYRLGIVRAKQKKYKEAIQEFEAALAEAPWFIEAYYNLGLVYDFNKEYSKALRVLNIYAKLSPDAPNIGTVKTKIVELKDKMGLLRTSIEK